MAVARLPSLCQPLALALLLLAGWNLLPRERFAAGAVFRLPAGVSNGEARLELAASPRLRRDDRLRWRDEGAGLLGLRLDSGEAGRPLALLETLRADYERQLRDRDEAERARRQQQRQHQRTRLRRRLRLLQRSQPPAAEALPLNGSEAEAALLAVELQLLDLQREENQLAELYTKDHPNYQTLLAKRELLGQRQRQLQKQRRAPSAARREAEALGAEIQGQLQRLEMEDLQEPWTAPARVSFLRPPQAEALPPRWGWLLLPPALLLAGWGRRRQEDIGAELAPLLATVPPSRAQRPGLLLALDRPQDPAVLALRPLWAQIYLGRGERPGATVVLLAGALPGQGCSFISANLAVLLAQSGAKTLLWDGNGYRSPLGQRLARPSEALPPLTLAPAPSAQAGLDWLSLDAMPTPPGWPRLEQLLAEARRRYDFIVIDAPPLLASDDGWLWGQRADRCYWVQGPLSASARARLRARIQANGFRLQGRIANGYK